MKREIWSDLIVFAKACQYGSFTAASKELDISPSAVSHTIKKLEARLETRLLHRSTRSIAPTESGQKLLEQLEPAIQIINATIETFNIDSIGPKGRIRITSHSVAAKYTLLSRLKAFMAQYPKIIIEIDIDDSLVDFISKGFDAGIRHYESVAPDMIAVQIDKPDQLIYVASPSYISHKGVPSSPEDLQNHHCITYRFKTSGSLFGWPFIEDGREYKIAPTPSLIVNDTDMLLNAALDGYGIVCITKRQAQTALDNGDLCQIFNNQYTVLPANYLLQRILPNTTRKDIPCRYSSALSHTRLSTIKMSSKEAD